jgi:hypothetical protein
MRLSHQMRGNLARAAVLSAQVLQRLQEQATQQEVLAEARKARQQLEEQKKATRRCVEERRQARQKAQRVKLATKGLKHILMLAEDRSMKKIVQTDRNEEIIFFSECYLCGETYPLAPANFRISFTLTGIKIVVTEDFGPGLSDEVKVFFNGDTVEWNRLWTNPKWGESRDKELTGIVSKPIPQFLEKIAWWRGFDIKALFAQSTAVDQESADPESVLSYEFDPDGVLFELLVLWGDKAEFEKAVSNFLDCLQKDLSA